MKKYVYTIVTDNNDFNGEFDAEEGDYLEMMEELAVLIEHWEKNTKTAVISIKLKENQDESGG